MKKNILLSLISGLMIIGCANNPTQLPKETNPAIIGGYTVPARFNWLQDSNVDQDSRKIKALITVAQQNPNNQVVIFYGSSCKNIAEKINAIFKSKGYKTFPLANKDPHKPDIAYVYINFAPLNSAQAIENPTADKSVAFIKNTGQY